MIRFTPAAIAMALAAAALPALAQQPYPAKSVRFIIPFPPGGPTDILGRLAADALSKSTGVQFVADNRPGAGGNIGTELCAKSPADGYTVCMMTVAQSISPAIYARLGFDPLKDFAHVTLVAQLPSLLMVHPSVPAKNVKELVALAKPKAGRITMGSPGPGSTNHLAGEMFQLSTGVKFTHVPYKGNGPALIDLMGGQIDIVFDQMTASIGYVRGGKLRALGVAQSARSSQLPDVPTLAEQGCKGCEASTFAGLFAPGGMPKPILDRLAEATAKVVASKPVHDRFVSLGAEPKSSTPEEFAQLVRTDVARWARVVKEANIKLD